MVALKTKTESVYCKKCHQRWIGTFPANEPARVCPFCSGKES